jgi:hypothetical protein
VRVRKRPLLGALASIGAGFVSSGSKNAIAFLLLIVTRLVRPHSLRSAWDIRTAHRR